MKIVVPVKAVATLDDEFVLDRESRVDPADLEFALNEWDEFALETALLLREQAGDGQVLVVSVGDEPADDALRRALAKGADRAQRIWSEALVDADPLSIARVLAAAIAPERADLILCGVQSADAANGATGTALAAFLDLPRVAVVRGLRYDAADATATVERELEGGLVEVLRVRTPALLTIQTGIHEPRYANLRAIKLAAQQPVTLLAPDDLGLDDHAIAAVAGSRTRGLRPLERGSRARMLPGNPGELAASIARIISETMAG